MILKILLLYISGSLINCKEIKWPGNDKFKSLMGIMYYHN